MVNTFGPFRNSAGHLELAGYNGFTEAQFERKCPIWPGQRFGRPNLDFFAASPEVMVAVESKFLEALSRPKVTFQESYKTRVQALAEPAWQDMYTSLTRHPKRFECLDAAQLVKHYLGLRYTFREYETIKVLMYLYWEPVNTDGIPLYERHRQEVSLFAQEVEGNEIQFMPLSYQALWRNWSDTIGWSGILDHINELRQRYEVRI